MTEPLLTNNFNTKPYIHNLMEHAVIPGPQACFSGDWLLHVQAWGAYGLYTVDILDNIISGGRNGMISPVTDMGPSEQPPAWCECNGDFHQSALYIVATPNTPKWVVTTIPNIGAVGSCSGGKFPAKVQIYKLSNTLGLRWHSQAFIASGGSNHRLDGDMAYIDTGTGWWTPINMETGVMGADTQNPPAFTPQPNIQGFTFTITKTSATNDYRLDRIGGVVPTLFKANPLAVPNRQQMFATIWNVLKDLKQRNPTLNIPPVEMAQQFCDVLPSNFAYEAFNSLKAAGIISGGNEPCP